MCRIELFSWSYPVNPNPSQTHGPVLGTHTRKLLIVMPVIHQQPLKHFQIPLDRRPAQRRHARLVGIA